MKKEISEKEQKENKKDQNYDFINKDISKFLSCPSCALLMKKPMRLHPCGHNFCDRCAPVKGNCHTCKAKIQATQKDLVGQGLVNELLVKCLNQGCVYKGSFQDFKKHHQGKCKLQFGLDQWMESMKNSLQQLGPKKKNYSSQNQSGNQEPKAESVKKQAPKFNISQRQKIGKINWEEEPFTKRQLKKQL